MGNNPAYVILPCEPPHLISGHVWSARLVLCNVTHTTTSPFTFFALLFCWKSSVKSYQRLHLKWSSYIAQKIQVWKVRAWVVCGYFDRSSSLWSLGIWERSQLYAFCTCLCALKCWISFSKIIIVQEWEGAICPVKWRVVVSKVGWYCALVQLCISARGHWPMARADKSSCTNN